MLRSASPEPHGDTHRIRRPLQPLRRQDGDLNGAGAARAGSYTLEVDVFSAAAGRGTLLDSFEYDFTVTGSSDALLV